VYIFGGVTDDEISSDSKLDQDDALALIRHYRSDPTVFGTRRHALLELAWHTGARASGLRALDLRDMRETDDGQRYLAFVNREETGTRLKKGNDGERPVRISEETWSALNRYVEHHRIEQWDEHGRQPLLTSRVGRPTPGTIRDWMYLATIPCLHSRCPHERDPDTCEYTEYDHASGCPSSRSPHEVRTGAITWMRNKGKPAEAVAERVNAKVETIEKHYDKEDSITEMIERRDPYFSGFDIDSESDNE